MQLQLAAREGQDPDRCRTSRCHCRLQSCKCGNHGPAATVHLPCCGIVSTTSSRPSSHLQLGQQCPFRVKALLAYLSAWQAARTSATRSYKAQLWGYGDYLAAVLASPERELQAVSIETGQCFVRILAQHDAAQPAERSRHSSARMAPIVE